MSAKSSIRAVSGDRLFVGPAASLDEVRAVLDRGVEAVVCVASEPLPADWPRDLPFLRLPITDDTHNPEVLLQMVLGVVTRFLQDEVPTLIVCSMGSSRSVAVAAAAVAVHRCESPDDVLRQMTAGQPADVMPALWNSMRSVVHSIQAKR